MQKKVIISLSILAILAVCFGCQNKQSVQKETISIVGLNEEVEESTTEETTELVMDDFSANSPISSSNSSDIQLTGGAFATAEDFTNYDYYNAVDIFTVTKTTTKTDEQAGMVYVFTEAQGSIAGIPGTFTIQLPFNENFKVNDQCEVYYKKAYDDILDRLIVSDIVYNQKVKVDIKSRQERIAEEESKAAVEESIKAEEEAAAQKVAEEEAKKQKEQEEAKKRQQALAAQQEQARLAALQAQQQSEQERLNALNAQVAQSTEESTSNVIMPNSNNQ